MPNPAAKYIDEFRRETADYIISTGRPITERCAELGLNSKTVNKWVQNRRRELAGGPDPKAEDRELREAVRRVWLESDRRFGFRFVKRFLPGEFSGLTLYRVRKLMREPGIRGCTPNARKRTAIPDPKAKPRPDLVRRDFTGPVPACKLVGDIAYLRTGEGRLHLSTVIDPNTRMVVGRSLSARMTADIAVSAPASAKSRGYVAGNAIFHADRGAQHSSRLLAEWARDNDVRLSCSRSGDCRDNAVAESFFATLKNTARPKKPPMSRSLCCWAMSSCPTTTFARACSRFLARMTARA